VETQDDDPSLGEDDRVKKRITLLLAILWFVLLGVSAYALGRSDPIHCVQDYVGKPMPADAHPHDPAERSDQDRRWTRRVQPPQGVLVRDGHGSHGPTPGRRVGHGTPRWQRPNTGL